LDRKPMQKPKKKKDIIIDFSTRRDII